MEVVFLSFVVFIFCCIVFGSLFRSFTFSLEYTFFKEGFGDGSGIGGCIKSPQVNLAENLQQMLG